MRTDWNVPVRTVAVVLWVGLLLAAGAGATTYGLLFDTEQANGTIRAADDFGFPDGAVAYDDANGNNRWDGSERTYGAAELKGLSDSSVDLRFHHKNGKKVSVSGTIDVDVASIEAGTSVDISAESVQLSATEAISLSGLTTDKSVRSIEITSDYGEVTLRDSKLSVSNSILLQSNNGDVDISGAKLTAPTRILVSAQRGTAVLNKKTKCKASQIVIRDRSGTQHDCKV